MRVLIVDDNCELAKLLCDGLRRHGIESEFCCDGKEALEELNDSEYDAMVTDLHMPNVDGIQLIVEARKAFPNLPIIAMSGVHTDVSLPGAKRLGAKVCLEKPFEESVLLDCLRDLVPDNS